ncbi:MAG: class I SAM-dependent methyltransferase [Streptosporangiaceae bacterium]
MFALDVSQINWRTTVAHLGTTASSGSGSRHDDQHAERNLNSITAPGIEAKRGHRVIGVDSSPDMLAHARQRVPEGDFRLAELDRLPLPDDSVDVIVCALALVHVPRLDPVLAEFARVLRPGGDLVISDIHHELVTRGSVITARGPAGEPCIVTTYRHQLGDYLRAALSLGLQVRRCEEPGRTAQARAAPLPEPATKIGDWQDWPWSLMDYLPSAARAAGGRPWLVIWHFQRT